MVVRDGLLCIIFLFKHDLLVFVTMFSKTHKGGIGCIKTALPLYEFDGSGGIEGLEMTLLILLVIKARD